MSEVGIPAFLQNLVIPCSFKFFFVFFVSTLSFWVFLFRYDGDAKELLKWLHLQGHRTPQHLLLDSLGNSRLFEMSFANQNLSLSWHIKWYAENIMVEHDTTLFWSGDFIQDIFRYIQLFLSQIPSKSLPAFVSSAPNTSNRCWSNQWVLLRALRYLSSNRSGFMSTRAHTWWFRAK